MISDEFKNQSTVTTVFSFLAQISADVPSSAQAIANLAAAQSINGTGYQGIGETNDGGVTTSLPLYKLATLGNSVTLCSSDDVKDIVTGDLGENNRLGNYDFSLISLPAVGTRYSFASQYLSGSMSGSVDLRLMLEDNFFIRPLSTTNPVFVPTSARTPTLLIYTSSQNIDGTSNTSDGDVCHNITVTQ